MRAESLDLISLMQKNAANIRNICILAHVDHGKTTLADSLIASNGIISSRLAGKLRYMDSREDEQQRGITMKSSAISLYHMKDKQNYLVNLIDSPGHIDFSSEVSTAVRLCDGAIVIVDVVEGVCPQTNAVLRQAWLEGIKPCLVLNKMDRLITELKLTPLEAFYHLQKVLEQVNAITGSLFSTKIMEESSKDQQTDIEQTEDQSDVFDWSSGLDDADDENLYFSPEFGNVVFASAIDGWAFGIDTFADLYSAKLGISKRILMKTLWGDYFLNMKAKKILKGAYTKGKKPLFVQFILDNLWILYEAVLNRDKPKITKIVESLNVKITSVKFSEPKAHLQAILRQWLPLSSSILDLVCSYLPSPLEMREDRVKKLMCSGFKKFESYPDDTQKLKDDFLKCSSTEEAPVIVFVSKMLSVDAASLPEKRRRPLTKEEMTEKYEAAKQRHAEKNIQRQEGEEGDNTEQTEQNKPDEETEEKQDDEEHEKEHFVAFARVFSGTLKKGMKLYVLGPKYDPSLKIVEKSHTEVPATSSKSQHQFDSQQLVASNGAVLCEIKDLYLMMGKEFEALDEVPAGNMIGINGFSDSILKSGTASTSLACPPFTSMTFEAKPIVRVAVEPRQPSQLQQLVRGMRLLNQADPCVEVMVQESGEYVIVAAGEVHLQRCLDDLTERFAKIKIRASDPIVPFRESVVNPPKIDMVNEEISEINKSMAHHTQRLPAFMLKEIQSFSDLIHKHGEETAVQGGPDESSDVILSKNQVIEAKKSAKMKEKTGLIEAFTANKQYCMCLQAKPLSSDIVDFLDKNFELLKIIQKLSTEPNIEDRKIAIKELTTEIRASIKNLYNQLDTLFENSGKDWRKAIDRIWAVGPKGSFTNILFNNVPDYNRSNIWFGLLDDNQNDEENDLRMREYDNSIVSGFQLAVQSGPMCEEPMRGVAFMVTDWSIQEKQTAEESSIKHGPLSGQHISSFREGCRRAVMAQPMRLMAAMYTCEIQATTEVLGKVYSVINKRLGKILSEDLKEGSDIFDIHAELPVAESFGFAEEIRKKTSGLASPQLIFNRWQVLDEDPFWIPTTEEEYELYGEKADSENQALKYVNKVRHRKGLYVEKKTVEHAEKQRTLKRNK